LQILCLNLVIQDACEMLRPANSDHFKDALQHLLEALEVPVLVNTGVDHSRVEDLLGFLTQEEAQVVNVVDGVVAMEIVCAVVGQ